MSAFITLMNTADKLAGYYRSGTLAAVVLADWLVERGFYAIDIEPFAGRVIAYRDGVRFDLGSE
jgi:hypothetical protein